MDKTGGTWKKYRMAAIIFLILWLLYLANKDYVEAIDWYINIKYHDSLSKKGICAVLGKLSIFAAIFCGLMAVGYFVKYTKAPTVLCPACGLTYKDEVGDGVCPYCGRNKNDYNTTNSAQVPKWLCSCGSVHPGYVSTCSCGKKKREGTMLDQQIRSQNEDQTKYQEKNDDENAVVANK